MRRLNDFPTMLKLESISNSSYNLIGLVSYVHPNRSRKVSETNTGHYQAYIRMPNNSWLVCDDFNTVAKRATVRTIVMPNIIIYRKL